MTSGQSILRIRQVDSSDLNWVQQFLIDHWSATHIVAHGEKFQADCLPGFVAVVDDDRVGLVTYRIDGRECEIISIDSLVIGAGAQLVEAVKATANKNNCRRLWLITTNDNVGALRFYQKIGFVLKAVHPKALDVSRKLKPSIPLIGLHGIPLRDEIELEMML